MLVSTIISILSAGFITGLGLIVAIGAQNAFVLHQGLQKLHVGYVVAICALGDIILILAGVAGMGAFVHQWPGLLQILYFCGAIFLGWYGLSAAKRAWTADYSSNLTALTSSDTPIRSKGRVILACLAFTFLNPHVYLDTMVLIGSLSSSYPGAFPWLFGLGACIASISWFSALGFGARFLRPVFYHPLSWKIFDLLVAVLMLSLCLFLLLSIPR